MYLINCNTHVRIADGSSKYWKSSIHNSSLNLHDVIEKAYDNTSFTFGTSLTELKRIRYCETRALHKIEIFDIPVECKLKINYYRIRNKFRSGYSMMMTILRKLINGKSKLIINMHYLMEWEPVDYIHSLDWKNGSSNLSMTVDVLNRKHSVTFYDNTELKTLFYGEIDINCEDYLLCAIDSKSAESTVRINFNSNNDDDDRK